MKAKVFFAKMAASKGGSMLDKVDHLFTLSGMDEIIAPNDLVAIKVHFGERGNTAYVRPQFIRRLVNRIKTLGGKPFLSDANTLYVGSRANAVDHLSTAVENGFSYAVVDAPLIIGDGLTGKDYVSVPVGLKHFREVKIGSAFVHADSFIAVTHFKGHEMTGFGGVLKNIGMGCGSRSGKQMMHSDMLPFVDQDKCIGCEKCGRWCPTGAITLVKENGKSSVDENKCIGCGECTVTCPVEAIKINWKTESDIIQEKIVEYTIGVLKNKKAKAGFITFLNNISPYCDCYGWADAPVIRDVGILASLDPVALDQACVDLVNKERGLEGSLLEGKEEGDDKFRALFPSIDWNRQLVYAEEIGLGSRKYELIPV